MSSEGEVHGWRFGEAVRNARTARGWSQAHLAELVGTTQSTIDRLEKSDSTRSRVGPEVAAVLGIRYPLVLGAAANTALERARTSVAERENERASPKPMLADLGVFYAEDRDSAVSIHAIAVDTEKRIKVLSAEKGAFGFIVPNYEMFPAYEAGDTALVHPTLTLVRGCDVLLIGERELPDFDGYEGKFRAKLCRLVEWDAETWTIHVWTNLADQPATFAVPKTEWPSAMRIVGKVARK